MCRSRSDGGAADDAAAADGGRSTVAGAGGELHGEYTLTLTYLCINYFVFVCGQLPRYGQSTSSGIHPQSYFSAWLLRLCVPLKTLVHPL